MTPTLTIKIMQSHELRRLLYKPLSPLWMPGQLRIVLTALVPSANRQQHFEVSVRLLEVSQALEAAFASVVLQVLPWICKEKSERNFLLIFSSLHHQTLLL